MLYALYAGKHIDLRFGDESHFSRMPYIPYGWMKKGTQLGIPSEKGKAMNVFGLMSPAMELTSFEIPGNVNSAKIIECMNTFAASITKVTVVILDNSSVHTSAEFKEQIQKWEDLGLFLFFLPTYSPHLNIIEILWRKIKYEWLTPKDYESKDTLVEAIRHILKKFGTDYKIHFSLKYQLT